MQHLLGKGTEIIAAEFGQSQKERNTYQQRTDI
jgi:hypothetical protein